VRVGIDIGGTKVAAIALDAWGMTLAQARREVPRDYGATLGAMRDLTSQLESDAGRAAERIGISVPGMISDVGVPVRAVNLPWLEGRPLAGDLRASLRRPVRVANDANCFALSEAVDGAAAGHLTVFGAILGTGVGGAIVIGGTPVAGANAVAGEWGHNPLLPDDDCVGPAVLCGCGQSGCIETWLNGAALARDYAATAGERLDAQAIAARAAAGEAAAGGVIGRYESRLARALATVINLLDPDVIVLGGGLSEVESLYRHVPTLWGAHCVAPSPRTALVRALHGPHSGMRGAAWL